MKGAQGQKENYVVFERTDNALPFFPAEAKSILSWANVLEDLNDYHLKVLGLAPGRYEVRQGGKKIAEYTAEDLATGVKPRGPASRYWAHCGPGERRLESGASKNRYFHDRIFSRRSSRERQGGRLARQNGVRGYGEATTGGFRQADGKDAGIGRGGSFGRFSRGLIRWRLSGWGIKKKEDYLTLTRFPECRRAV